MTDPDFQARASDLIAAIDPVVAFPGAASLETLPNGFPETGLGAAAALERLAPVVLGGARWLGAPQAFAHMDPPTPWVTWVTALWNASLNQNLLHPDIAPAARELEVRAIDWIAPAFGMDGGHMTPGSTISNLTALGPTDSPNNHGNHQATPSQRLIPLGHGRWRCPTARRRRHPSWRTDASRRGQTPRD